MLLVSMVNIIVHHDVYTINNVNTKSVNYDVHVLLPIEIQEDVDDLGIAPVFLEFIISSNEQFQFGELDE